MMNSTTAGLTTFNNSRPCIDRNSLFLKVTFGEMFVLIRHIPSAMFTLNGPHHRQDQEKLLASEDLERTQALTSMVSGLCCGSGDVFTISSMAFSFSLNSN